MLLALSSISAEVTGQQYEVGLGPSPCPGQGSGEMLQVAPSILVAAELVASLPPYRPCQSIHHDEDGQFH